MKHNVSRFEQTDAKITRYIDGEFYIYIVEDGTEIEWYLQQIGSGFMQYGWGSNTENSSKEDFVNLVRANLREYKAGYLKELAEYEEFLEQEAE